MHATNPQEESIKNEEIFPNDTTTTMLIRETTTAAVPTRETLIITVLLVVLVAMVIIVSAIIIISFFLAKRYKKSVKVTDQCENVPSDNSPKRMKNDTEEGDMEMDENNSDEDKAKDIKGEESVHYQGLTTLDHKGDSNNSKDTTISNSERDIHATDYQESNQYELAPQSVDWNIDLNDYSHSPQYASPKVSINPQQTGRTGSGYDKVQGYEQIVRYQMPSTYEVAMTYQSVATYEQIATYETAVSYQTV